MLEISESMKDPKMEKKQVNFVYNFKNYDGKEAQISYPIEIPYVEDYRELSHRIVAEKMHQMMTFLDEHKGNKNEC